MRTVDSGISHVVPAPSARIDCYRSRIPCDVRSRVTLDVPSNKISLHPSIHPHHHEPHSTHQGPSRRPRRKGNSPLQLYRHRRYPDSTPSQPLPKDVTTPEPDPPRTQSRPRPSSPLPERRPSSPLSRLWACLFYQGCSEDLFWLRRQLCRTLLSVVRFPIVMAGGTHHPRERHTRICAVP